MPSFFLSTSFIFIYTLLLSYPTNCLGEAEDSLQRKSDTEIHSVSILPFDRWVISRVASDPNNSDNSGDLYLPNSWTVFISSNETILSDGACPLFQRFVCSNPDCFEDTSSVTSHGFSMFSTSDATRLNLTAQTISLAGGAWQINAPTLYIHSCETFVLKDYRGIMLGQIGLGLSGKASQNFQAINPTFSIIFHKSLSTELIFGFNSTYVNDLATAISLPCDLDWKVQVKSGMVGNLTLFSNSVTLIFDLETKYISLPLAYFTSLRNYFFSISKPGECMNQTKGDVSFLCFRFDSLQDLPSLIFSLESGAQFILPPTGYAIASGSDNYGVKSISYNAQFAVYNSTILGMEYIILGKTALFNYYTVFQRLSNQTPTITLYPVNRDPFDTNQLQIKSNSTETQGNFSSPSQIIPISNTTSSPSESETQNTSKGSNNTTSDSEHSNDPEITQAKNYNDVKVGESDYSLYVIIIVIFIVMACGIVVYLCLKGPRQGLTHNKMIKEHRSTLELNGSSYFVSSNNPNVHNNPEIGGESE